jgi:hypothetical protein
MRVDLTKFKALYDRLFQIDYDGAVPGICVSLNNAASIRAATAKGTPFLPPTYQEQFAAPMDAKLPGVMSKLDQQVQSGERPAAYRALVLEALYGAIYQHGFQVTPVEARPQLKRFLAVVSNLYRSFVDANKLTAAGVTLATEIPPLALFQSVSDGPFTIESDLMKEKFGLSIGVVSLPATYCNDPVIWAGLSHEIGGHDVVHADAGLVEEMESKTRALLAPVFKPRRNHDNATLNALIWSYWMDEAAADVYGVLNMGPSFALNLAGFLAAFRAKRRGQTAAGDPFVTNDTAVLPNGDMDAHPVDLLRFQIAIGAVEGLKGLSAGRRNDYVASIEAVADLVGFGVTEIGLRGRVTIDGDNKVDVHADMKLSDAAAAARRVGKMLATDKFARLNNHSVQDIETWDDADEDIAQDICDKVLAGKSIVASGDDAQLLAGVTMALLQKPDLYKVATKSLEEALDDSFDRDPIWGATLRGHALAAAGGRAMARAREEAEAAAKAKVVATERKSQAAKKPAAKKKASKRR